MVGSAVGVSSDGIIDGMGCFLLCSVPSPLHAVQGEHSKLA